MNRPKILVVDNVPDNIEVLDKILGHDYKIFSSQDGFDAISMAEAKHPDLIILNIIMSGMDGFETCRKLKENPATKSIPIIFITDFNLEEDEAKALELGAVDYITRPMRPSVVRARVKNHLELKKYRDYLQEISMKDGLTGIANRRRLDEYLQQEWRRSQRQKKPISLLMLDIDHFKFYNDHYGHSAGDDCLKKIAGTIEDALARPADLAARYGGEEFACVLPETDNEGAGLIAQRIHQNLAALAIPHEHSPISRVVTISIGIATTVPEHSSALDQFIKKADEMLYEAKNSGRNQTRSQII
jgi:diguanylate cyclase (GGDEF)-like protein